MLKNLTLDAEILAMQNMYFQSTLHMLRALLWEAVQSAVPLELMRGTGLLNGKKPTKFELKRVHVFYENDASIP